MASKASDESSVSGAGSAGGQSKVTLDIPDGRDSAFSLAGDEDSTRPSPKACVRNFIRFIDLLNRIRRQSKGKVGLLEADAHVLQYFSFLLVGWTKF